MAHAILFTLKKSVNNDFYCSGAKKNNISHLGIVKALSYNFSDKVIEKKKPM